MDNTSKIATSEICQRCAKCCKEFAKPQTCKVYPDNTPLSLIETEKKECPALVNFANANFTSQKETNKGLAEAAASKKSSSFLDE